MHMHYYAKNACYVQTNYPYTPIQLYTKLFTNNIIPLDLGYRKPQDCYVTLKYKNHFKHL